MTLRTEETEARYQQDIKDGKTKDIWEEELVHEDKFYRVVKNRYPYDRIAREHYLLLTRFPLKEAFAWAVKYMDENNLDQVIVNNKKNQSVPKINHIHIIRLQD